jgi:hypothetical protein
MIRNAAVARQISDLMVEFQGRLNSSIITVEEKCSSQEFKDYRLAVGKIMGEMLLEVMNPLYVKHAIRRTLNSAVISHFSYNHQINGGPFKARFATLACGSRN